MKCEESKAKLFDQTYLNKKTYLTKNQVENDLENLYTTRSCPTGYKERELKNCSTDELQNLRKITFEYLKFRSSKTRNVQFVHLVKRINKELQDRKVNTNMTLLLSEYLKSNEVNNTIFSGEYTLTKKLSNFDGSDCGFGDSMLDELLDPSYCDSKFDKIYEREKKCVIFTKYFTLKPKKKLEIPSFFCDDYQEKYNNTVAYEGSENTLTNSDLDNLKKLSEIILKEKSEFCIPDTQLTETEVSSNLIKKSKSLSNTNTSCKASESIKKIIFKVPDPIPIQPLNAEFNKNAVVYSISNNIYNKKSYSTCKTHYTEEDTLSRINRHFNEQIKIMKKFEEVKEENEQNYYSYDNPNNFFEVPCKKTYSDQANILNKELTVYTSQRDSPRFQSIDELSNVDIVINSSLKSNSESIKDCSTKSNSTMRATDRPQDIIKKCNECKTQEFFTKNINQAINSIEKNQDIANKEEEKKKEVDLKSDRSTSYAKGSDVADIDSKEGELYKNHYQDLISILKRKDTKQIRNPETFSPKSFSDNKSHKEYNLNLESKENPVDWI